MEASPESAKEHTAVACPYKFVKIGLEKSKEKSQLKATQEQTDIIEQQIISPFPSKKKKSFPSSSQHRPFTYIYM